ncbi:GbsR/MarR family transcriptional regulator [Methyloradius palustris]|uniref:HTH-type transcriptional regulator n=1 Tax=Methyloradius palustris TaxID=2778876 RepID=A0A8D5JZV4_9PROT|nr:MarR family transcriptional regulator [Methyloradius palustris]BCM26037.1 transcriptional regulator [Methyloradius palustris]
MENESTEQIALSDLGRQFVLHWGEMGAQWGINRTVSQIHALLYYTGKPLNAEQIASNLMVARSNVSNSLKELQNWNLVHITHVMGDRRDYFETSLDIWQLFSTVIIERKAREFDPTVNFLKKFAAESKFSEEEKDAKKRVEDILTLMETLSIWGDEMIRLKPETLTKIMKYGAKIQNLIRSKK